MKHNIFMSYLVGLCFMVIFHFCILLFSFRKVFMMWRNEKGAKQTIHQKNMNGKNIDDKQIIQAMRRSAGEGLRLLMAKYREPVYWHIRRLVVSHEDAQDAAQETFVRIYQSFSQIKSDKSFRSWMFRIATNEALRLIGARPQHEASLEADASQANHLMASDYVDYNDLEAVRLQKAILCLPTKQQLAFNLRYYDELSYDEIAEAIGSTVSAAKMNYHIAKEKIKKYMSSNN